MPRNGSYHENSKSEVFRFHSHFPGQLTVFTSIEHLKGLAFPIAPLPFCSPEPYFSYDDKSQTNLSFAEDKLRPREGEENGLSWHHKNQISGPQEGSSCTGGSTFPDWLRRTDSETLTSQVFKHSGNLELCMDELLGSHFPFSAELTTHFSLKQKQHDT